MMMRDQAKGTPDAVDYTAHWNGTQYVVDGGNGWYSEDGNYWLLQPGIAASGRDWDRARITLVNGPQNGKTVA